MAAARSGARNRLPSCDQPRFRGRSWRKMLVTSARIRRPPSDVTSRRRVWRRSSVFGLAIIVFFMVAAG